MPPYYLDKALGVDAPRVFLTRVVALMAPQKTNTEQPMNDSDIKLHGVRVLALLESEAKINMGMVLVREH